MQTDTTDNLLITLAGYVCDAPIQSTLAYDTARWCLLDALGCAALALKFPACTRLLGPVVAGTQVPAGVRVPGSDVCLDPVKAAFDIGTLIRWLDYNDTWLAQEWGHPSDNLGAILACADFMAQRSQPELTVRSVLTAMIKAYEIQGILALNHAFNALGIDHVVLVKIASAAVATRLLGGDKSAVIDALSQAWLDGHALRTYRHAPNTGSRKSWAAGDATSRAVRLAMMTLQGEMGYAQALSAARWGFHDAAFNGKPLILAQPLGSYVIENILFKVAYPAEFHAQTAVEAALQHHVLVKEKWDQIERIEIHTQAPALRIISKTGPLNNPADRDHCLEYMVAVALLEGQLTADHYSDAYAQQAHAAIEALRSKMHVQEAKHMTQDYYDASKRAIANAVTIKMQNCEPQTIQIDYPLGHVRRREQAQPLLLEKARDNLAQHYSSAKTARFIELVQDKVGFDNMLVTDFCAFYSDMH